MERTGALPLIENRVPAAWLDYNGHMNDAAYATLFSRGIDALMDLVGLDAETREREARTIYTLDMHIRYARECHEGDGLNVEAQLLDTDAKRLHVMMGAWLVRDDAPLAATAELMLICVDSARRRAAPFPPAVSARVDELWTAHRDLPRPSELGRRIGIRRQ